MSMSERGPSPTREPVRTRRTPGPPRCVRRGAPRFSGSTRAWSRPLAGCLAVLAGVASALALASCGSSGKGLIPLANAGPLQQDFEEVAQAAQTGGGDCAATTAALNKTERDFAALPGTIDTGLHARLSEGIANLRERALALCAQPSTQTAASTPRTTTGTATTTTRTQTTPTTTTPTSTSTTPTTPAAPTTPSTPPDNGGGTAAPGQGNGNGGENEQGGGTRAGEAGGAGLPEGGR